MKKPSIILLTFCAIAFLFVSCDSLFGSTNTLSGTSWIRYDQNEANDDTTFSKYTFKNNTLIMEVGISSFPIVITVVCTYTNTADTLTINIPQEPEPITTKYRIEGNKFIIETEEDTEVIFTRVN